jgi:hypothetical protein
VDTLTVCGVLAPARARFLLPSPLFCLYVVGGRLQCRLPPSACGAWVWTACPISGTGLPTDGGCGRRHFCCTMRGVVSRLFAALPYLRLALYPSYLDGITGGVAERSALPPKLLARALDDVKTLCWRRRFGSLRADAFARWAGCVARRLRPDHCTTRYIADSPQHVLARGVPTCYLPFYRACATRGFGGVTCARHSHLRRCGATFCPFILPTTIPSSAAAGVLPCWFRLVLRTLPCRHPSSGGVVLARRLWWKLRRFAERGRVPARSCCTCSVRAASPGSLLPSALPAFRGAYRDYSA